jgi:hypothetical protein
MQSLTSLLNFLEENLRPEIVENSEKCHQLALNWEPVERLPLVISYPFPKSKKIQPFPHGEVFGHPEKMLFNELVHAFDTSILLHSELLDDLSLTIRANFGTVAIASLFGGVVEQRENNPPWIRHFETLDEFKTIFERDPLDFSQGICPQITARYQFYRDMLEDYPNLQKCIKIVLPDLQGPLDSLELLRGSEIYSDFVLDPEMIESGLKRMAEAQIGFARYLQQFTTDGKEGFTHQHSVAVKGNILIRNDSAIMISPEMYADQVAPYDELVLKELGGGGIHSCGKIDFNVPEIFKLESVKCFDFGQSYLNEVEPIYLLAREKKIPLLRLRPTRDELMSGEILKRFPTGVSLVYDASSYEDALLVAKVYYRR